MNIIKKIVLFNRINKALKQAKQLIDRNREVTEEVKTIIANLKSNIEALVAVLPSLKVIYEDIKNILK